VGDFVNHCLTDPWDALDVLEGHASEPGFFDCWRAFLRACSALLLPNLPPVAQEWATAADTFDRGRLSVEDLTEVRVQAWHFHDAREDSSPLAELSGLRAVMWRLWPAETADCWHESASYYLDFCQEAGLREEQWWPLLREQFPTILGTKDRG